MRIVSRGARNGFLFIAGESLVVKTKGGRIDKI